MPQTDDEGYLVDPEQWTEDWAVDTACALGLQFGAGLVALALGLLQPLEHAGTSLLRTKPATIPQVEQFVSRILRALPPLIALGGDADAGGVEGKNTLMPPHFAGLRHWRHVRRDGRLGATVLGAVDQRHRLGIRR